MKTTLTLLIALAILVIGSFFKCGKTQGAKPHSKQLHRHADSAIILKHRVGSYAFSSTALFQAGTLIDNAIIGGRTTIY